MLRTMIACSGGLVAVTGGTPAFAQFSPAWMWNRHNINVATTGAISTIRGYEFTVSEPIVITAIGVFDDEVHYASAATSQSFPGLAQAHPVALWNLSNTSTPLATGDVEAGQATPLCQDGYRYAQIAPTMLVAGNTYVVSTYWPGDTGSGNFDPYPDVQSSAAPVTLDPRVTIVQARHLLFATGNQFPASGGGQTNGYIGLLNFRIGAGACEPNPEADLITTFRSDNSQAGNMFDIAARSAQGITIDAWQINLGNGVTNATPVDVSIYWREGSFVGFESTPDGWNLLGTVSVVSWGRNQATPVAGGAVGSLFIPGGQVRGIFITTDFMTGQPPPASPAPLHYSNIPPATGTYANDDVQISGGIGKANPRFTGATFASRMWNGGILYTVGRGCYANCDNSTVPPILNVDDFTCFINEFAAATALPHEQQIPHYANCDHSTTAPVLNVDDFTCFINAFAQGCP